MKFVVIAHDVGIERQALREVVEVEFLNNLEPLALALHLLERLEGFRIRGIVVTEIPFPILVLFPRCGFARGVAAAIGIAKGEISRVVRHRETLCGYIETQARHTEILVDNDLVGNVAQRIALALGSHCVKGLVHIHIGIERIVAGRSSLLAVRIIDGSLELNLSGQEAARLYVGGHGVFVKVIVATLRHSFFQSSEAFGFDVATEIDGGHVGELDIERGLCGPTALVAELLKAEFVGPHLHTLVGTRIVAHTNHYGAHLAQGGVTHDANFVARTRGVVFAIELGVGDCSLRLLDVAVLLEIRQDVKVNVQHIVFGPYDARTSIAVGVFSFGGNGEGNLVFVEIALVVRSQTYEEAGLTVLNRLLAHEAIGMGKHLQVLVATQVKADIFIDSTGIARRKIANGHCQCLLVVLQYLFLSRL